jgi:hypothetical protein
MDIGLAQNSALKLKEKGEEGLPRFKMPKIYGGMKYQIHQ